MARSLQAEMSDREGEVDVLLMEGTHFGFPDGHTVTEYELEDEIVKHVRQAPGLVLASFSPQHVDRLVALIRAAKKTGRTFVVDAYTTYVLHLIRSEIPVPLPGDDGLRMFYPKFFADRPQHQARKTVDQYASSRIGLNEIVKSPSKFLMVFRATMLEPDFNNELPEETTCLYSRWSGYLDNEDWTAAKQVFDSCCGQVIEVHTSGHMLSTDIPKFVAGIGAKQVLPVHTFEPTEFKKHFDNVLAVADGQGIEVG